MSPRATSCATSSPTCPGSAGGAPPLVPPRELPAGDPSRYVPANQRKVYDVRDVIKHLVDGGFLLELARRWARNMVVGPGGSTAARRRHRQPAALPRRHARR